VSRFSSRGWGLAAWLLATATLTACELGTVTIPKTTPTIVVHAVLNPLATEQIVLVERTLTGSVTIPDTTYDPAEPILSAGGVPVSGAIVEITDPNGVVYIGVEDRAVSASGKGAGAYRVPLRGPTIMLGGRYTLRVRAQTGEQLSAATRVPRATIPSTGGLTRSLNRDHDVLLATWGAVDGARSYAVRVESPFGPFFLFTDSTGIRMSGDLRNLFTGDLQRVFIPGFRQDMFIAAVDSNFYDYYRTNNDPFTGSGIISRVNGGLGLFGSIVNLNTGTISVSADQTEPIEGRFRLVPATSNPSLPTLLTLYVESPASRSDLPTALSGRYNLGNSTARSDGLIGRMVSGDITLALLANQLAGDTVDVFEGKVQGDTLRGSYRISGIEAVFVKTP
jgi:Domain of unknown function (DUF4249)